MEIKNEINAKIDSTKKFVKKHKTFLAYTAGVVVGATGVAVALSNQSALIVTREQIRHMQSGGVVAYESPVGTILTWIKPDNINIPTT